MWLTLYMRWTCDSQFSCLLDWIYNQLGDIPVGESVSIFPGRICDSVRPLLKVVSTFEWQSGYTKGWRKSSVNFAVCYFNPCLCM